MAPRSGVDRYLRLAQPPGLRSSPGRLAPMRVRIFELRLIAAGLTALWTIVAALVLLGYRPGGPIDIVVGLAAVPPVVIAAASLVWPPAARDDRVFAVTVWIGLLVGLLLIRRSAASSASWPPREPRRSYPRSRRLIHGSSP